MRIAICDPPAKERYYHANFPNLGILYLISSLRERFGQKVQILYLDGHRSASEHIKALKNFQPELYGLSFAFFTQELAYHILEMVRSEFPNLPIICGGPMPSADPQEVLKRSAATICVSGEGEETFCELAGLFIDHNKSLDQIKGITFKDSYNTITETPKRSPIPDINRIPFPAWDLIDFSLYKGWHVHRSSPQLHLLISRGCPYDCNYCSNPVWKYTRPWLRLRSPENIKAEVDLLYKRGVREIYLSADEFNVKEDWALRVCQAIESLGYNNLYFNCNIRPDIMSPALAQAFRRINLWVVHLGIESGNQKTLDGVGKKVTLDQITEACQILKQEGIKVFGFVMLFHAWETENKLHWENKEDVDHTLDFCHTLLKKKLMDYMSWQVATPMPGSHLWDVAKKYNLLPDHEIRGVFTQNLNLPQVSHKDVKRALQKGLLIKNFYMVKNGNFNLRHLRAIAANLKIMLGLGPPKGAY